MTATNQGQTSRPRTSEHTFHPLAVVCAWLLPGLGHIVLGKKKRGGYVMFGVLFLFLGGLLIGGATVVDRKQQRLWFLAQSLCGPIAFVADGVNQKYVQALPDTDERRLDAVSIGHVNEIGTLFCALAGLMNLVAILDAVSPQAYKPSERRKGRG